jgi:2-keto-3-deoxy-L-rhamnonate aldolase RhmA
MMTRTLLTVALCLWGAVAVTAQTAGSETVSLRQRMLRGESLKNVRVPTDAYRGKVRSIIKAEKPDILYLDAHHSPCTEWDVSRIVKAAQELDVPVMMRIDHADQAGLISSLLDLGLFSIKVPTVEDEETVQKIIDGFYYPPLGKRSLGGSNNWGEDIAEREGKPYWQWWNENAILGFKLETVKGVLLARYLAKPGVVFMDFGGQDLRHDLEIRKHPGFDTVEDCREFVLKVLKGTDVYF